MNASTKSALELAALDIAAEVRKGRWRHVYETDSKAPAACDEIVSELRSRCPGLERAEYELAITKGLRAVRRPAIGKTLTFWFAAMTFVWALFILSPIMKQIPIRNDWAELLTYPAVCLIAAHFVFRQKRSGHVIFALLNLAGGISWAVFVFWAVRAFARSFWR